MATSEINWKNVELGMEHFATFAIPEIPNNEVRCGLIAMIKSALAYALYFRQCAFTPIIPEMADVFQYLADGVLICDDTTSIRIINHIERSSDGKINKVVVTRNFWRFLSEWGENGKYKEYISQRGVKLRFPWVDDCVAK